MTVAKPKTDVVNTEPYTEFLRALGIIEDTQLETFTDNVPFGKEEAIQEYNVLLEKAEALLDKKDENYNDLVNEKRIDIMRKILSKAVKQYEDKYANYIYPDALKKYHARRNGKIVGVGLKFRAIKDNYPLAIGPLTGGPMDGKDIRPGDMLVSIDDKPLFKLVAKEIEAALKGPVNSNAKLEILRDESRFTIDVKRSAVDLSYADSELLQQQIGYIKVSRFGSKTHVEVSDLLTDLIEQGALGFILDVRDNPGGSTRAARAIVSMFSTEKVIYCEKDKADEIKRLPRHGEHITDLPLAVLINSASMSCSEVFAGAIQTYNRGSVVGVTSFGKGLVQRIFILEEPLGGAVRTTIASMLRPDESVIHAQGVAPDVPVETDSDFMFRRTGSLNISAEARAFQRTLLERDVKAKKPKRAAELIAAKDAQLQAAIDKLLPLMSEP